MLFPLCRSTTDHRGFTCIAGASPAHRRRIARATSGFHMPPVTGSRADLIGALKFSFEWRVEPGGGAICWNMGLPFFEGIPCFGGFIGKPKGKLNPRKRHTHIVRAEAGPCPARLTVPRDFDVVPIRDLLHQEIPGLRLGSDWPPCTKVSPFSGPQASNFFDPSPRSCFRSKCEQQKPPGPWPMLKRPGNL